MNPKFRYDTSGQWFKGNTHIHSTRSDGGMKPADIAVQYAAAGYRFLFHTDHWVATDCAADPEAAAAPLLWMDGMEIDGQDETGAPFHVVCLGRVPKMDRSIGLRRGMEIAREHGAMLVLAHPLWCGNSFDDANRHGFDGVEVYNHVCHWINAKGEGSAYWQAMLKHNPGTRGFAADDSHLSPGHPGWNGGWVVVNAPALERDRILWAIRHGNFYSSMGPDFFAIEGNEKHVKVRTSPVVRMWIVGPAWCGRRVARPDGSPFTEAEFDIPADWATAHIEIEDARGRRAWTNPLLVK